MNRPLLAACFALLTVAAGAWADDELPPVFDRRPYAEAKKAAEEGKKWFIVKGTAKWCLPCKQMDQTTWRDEKVVKWLTDNAVVVAVDVDQLKPLATELKIQAMPTMIAFREGQEFDRVSGRKEPAEFLAWLEGIARGEKSIETIRAKAGTREGTVDVKARLNLARELTRAGKEDEATDEFVWLWQHMLEHDEGFYGVRLSYVVRDMGRLASRNPKAKQRFTELRDETGKLIQGEKVDTDDMVDWVNLNEVIGDMAATLAWYDKVKNEPRWRPLISRVAMDLENLLVAENRWADVGKLYDDPFEEIREQNELMRMRPATELPPGLSEADRAKIEEIPHRQLREKAGVLYAGLLAADRKDDAAKLAAAAREMDDSPKMTIALIETALQAKQPRAEHLEWLDQLGGADDERTKLREKVKAALK
jgi:thiol-disulfide isomerase/thioredoxin